MKQSAKISLITLIIPFILFSQVSLAAEFGKITLPLGKVEVLIAGSEDWSRAMPRQALNVNDQIRTAAKSRCEITLTGGGKVRIGENSDLVLTEANVKPMVKNFNATLKKGNAWVSAKAAFGEKKNVSIRTPTAVAAIRGTVYRTEAGEDESSVLVYEGKVDVNQPSNMEQEQQETKPEGKPKFKLGPVQEIQAPTEVPGPYEVSLEDWITLVEGMQINVRKDGKYNMFKFDQTVDAEDEFVQWNKELDGPE
ncbi:MAG: FecR domain-containing protein [Candidatus Marinimicrobia bacterium]|nr:FecR domain-containing protein [Candidatus Neomarinimicrobiota bacterium]